MKRKPNPSKITLLNVKDNCQNVTASILKCGKAVFRAVSLTKKSGILEVETNKCCVLGVPILCQISILCSI